MPRNEPTFSGALSIGNTGGTPHLERTLRSRSWTRRATGSKNPGPKGKKLAFQHWARMEAIWPGLVEVPRVSPDIR
jgi:hypothetical protein